MTITYLQDVGFLSVISEKLDLVIGNPSAYKSIEITGDLNCGACDSVFSDEVDVTTEFVADLNAQVQLGKTIEKFKFINIASGEFITANMGISLAGVISSCPSGECTLETSPVDYAGMFLTQIEGFFNFINVSFGTITVAFEGNKIIIGGLPDNYALYSFEDNLDSVTSGIFSMGESTNGVLLTQQGLLVPPSFFGLSEFIDGVYRIDLKIIADDNSYSIESNCTFVDVTFKCKVASLIKSLVLESQTKGLEKTSTVAHMLHYALVNGSNCGCNCEDLCRAYKELFSILYSAGLITQTTSNCGC